MMQIRVGFEMIYECAQPTPMIFNLNVHFTRVSDLVGRDDLVLDPPVPIAARFRRRDRERHRSA